MANLAQNPRLPLPKLLPNLPPRESYGPNVIPTLTTVTTNNRYNSCNNNNICNISPSNSCYKCNSCNNCHNSIRGIVIKQKEALSHPFLKLITCDLKLPTSPASSSTDTSTASTSHPYSRVLPPKPSRVGSSHQEWSRSRRG